MRFIHSELEAWLCPPVEAGAESYTGGHIVTPHPLAASALLRQHARIQIARGLKTWPQPSVLSLSAWLQQMWRDARARLGEKLPLLLSSAQEHFLWSQAIRQSGADVLDISATARSAMAAARFAAEWSLPLDHPSWDATEDTAQFRRWFADVEARCRGERWLPATGLLPFSLHQLPLLPLPRHLLFAGFAEMPEAARLLAAAIRSSGVAVEEIAPAVHERALVSLACSDLLSEFDAAARWARARLEENPKVSLAIFVHDLSEHRSTLERTLRDVLQPASALQLLSADPPANPPPFHIHCGLLPRRQPIIDAALSVIDLARPLVPMASVSAFLCSPYLPSSGEERNSRSLADASLRRARELELPLRVVERAIAHCPALGKIWPRIRAVLREMPAGPVEPAVWTRFWSRLIKSSGWPGDLHLSESESEAVDEWLDLLSAFDSLGLTGCRFSAAEALSHLRSMALEPAPSKGDLSAPIHVLEPGQAMPLRFDGAWLAGASELAWPPASFAPAYLPMPLLRGQGVPVATPQGRRARAQLLSNYIQTCASSVIASYSAVDAPGIRLSTLFQPLQEADRERLHLWKGEILLAQLKSQQLDEVEDSYGPRLTPGAVVSGGARLLKSQSDCPFQAFARWRLRAETLEDGEFSYDARQRGQFLHKALDVVWAELRDSQKLRSLAHAELETLVSRAVTAALSSDSSETDFRVQLRAAEQNRLVPLILEWLEIEKQRPGNFKIREAETTREFVLPGFSLRLRADRIDELDTGGLVIIDYKSGEKKRGELDSARPREPQLLAYAAMLASEGAPENEVEGLYFATLRRDACGAEGYGRLPYFNEAAGAGGWDLRLKEWQVTIRNLAEEFENGRASRATSSKPCEFCEMKSICRIEETRRQADLESAS